jgi:hypothetical protein
LKDFNWRSPLGLLAARDRPVPHHLTQDWVRVPGEVLQPHGSLYQLVATEELREISYFDQMRLLALDHPPGTDVYLDERFPMGPADPFRVYGVRTPLAFKAARDQEGTDLLPALAREDNRFTPVPDGGFRGVRPPHDLILDLGGVPDPRRVRLFLYGWLYPAPNSVNIAASQNPDVQVVPPTLWFGDGQGGWCRPDATVGIPCGKRKTIVLELSGRFTPGDYRIKLTTTFEIRWDRGFYTSGEQGVEIRRQELPLLSADLRPHGISEFYYEVPEGPDLRRYDRLLFAPGEDPRGPIEGFYTRLGDCAELLRAVDDRYAIIGHEDEIRLSYDGSGLPPLPPGWKRDFAALTDGWTKDSDPNTVAGEAVEPLPFHGMKRYPYGPEERPPDTPTHRKWRREWNTRYRPATVRPLKASRP